MNMNIVVLDVTMSVILDVANNNVQQTVLDAAIGEWRKRLGACVRAKGHHFEHLL